MSGGVRIEAEVRDAVRRAGIDPIRTPERIRALVDEAVARYDGDVLRGRAEPLADPEAEALRIHDAVAGFGPLQPFLDDPSIEEIWINEPGRVFVARSGRSELTTVVLTADAVRDLVERMLRPSGRRLDLSSPFVDAMLPDGSRIHVVIPDVTREHWAVNIRKFVARARSLDDLVRIGSIGEQAAAVLDAAVVAGLNIVVSGATGAGKTTLLNALLGSVPARDRVITCEEVFELQPPSADTVALQTRQSSLEGSGRITLRHLVKESLRMRPDRIVIGEVREAEALDMLIALNSGLPGMCSVHANTAREAVLKLCTLPLLAGENISAAFVVPTVASCIDVVVQAHRDTDGRRFVRDIVAVTGRVEGGIVETAELFVHRDGVWTRGRGFAVHRERFASVGIDIDRLLASDMPS
jgi:pilus assembly protein CpaF